VALVDAPARPPNACARPTIDGDMELRRRVLHAEILNPTRDFAVDRTEVEVRWDPLTGHSSRVLGAPRGLMPPNDEDLEAIGRQTAEGCPFCGDRLEARTPRFPPAVCTEGRIRRGNAVLFPNLFAYSRFSAVSVYSADLHYLSLGQMTPALVSNNLATQVAFARAAIACDPDAHWASINANHMLPSGSSLFHPHLQGSVDPVPTTMQRLLVDVPADRFHSYVDIEREADERYLGSSGRVHWLASFAPLAPGELRALAFDVASPAELDDDLVEELGRGIATAMNLYAELGFESFNLALYGAPPGTDGYPLNLRMACRSNLKALYRSDATYFERLHWEAAVDVSPEELAERAGNRFTGPSSSPS
jgi:UDPglucose--hexose-1-phosphate uridylyltransferase